MAVLQKLSIQGIRAFSYKDKNVIEFQTPLTIIVGANGTGKTTIIECLKFATTGDMPPNSRGGAFIFDPKLANEIDVKAEVKLRFRADRGEIMTCSRIMQSSSKKTRTEQKTLECTLFKLHNDKETLVTSKLADVDAQVPEFLGISHAVLDNVIFCHQDESTWPISDSAVMKKKLDDIFSSTKYNKALLGFKAAKKEIGTDLKLKEQELTHILKEKIKKDEIVKSIGEYSEEVDKKNNKLLLYSNEIEKLNNKLLDINNDLNIYEKLEMNAKVLKNELETCTVFISEFRYPLLESYNKDLVQQNLDTAQEILNKLTISNLEKEFEMVEAARQKFLEVEFKNKQRMELIKNNEDTIKRLTDERTAIILQQTKRFNCLEEELNKKISEKIKATESELKEKTAVVCSQRESLLIKKSEQKSKERVYNEYKQFVSLYKNVKINTAMDMTEIPIDLNIKVKLESEIDRITEELEAKQMQLNQLFRSGNGISKRNHLVDSIERLEKEMKETPELIKQQIDEIIKEKTALEEEMQVKSDINQRNIILNEQISKSNKENIRKINKCITILNENSDTCNENIKNRCIKIPQIEFICNFSFDEILKLKRSILSALPDIIELESIQSIECELETVKTHLLSSNSAVKVYENFINIVDKKQHCPVCVRAVDTNIKENVVNRLESTIKKIPEKVKEYEKKENELKLKLEQIQHNNARFSTVNTAINEIKSNLETLREYEPICDEEVTEIKKHLKIETEKLESYKNRYQQAKSQKKMLISLKEELANTPEVIDVKPLELCIKRLKEAASIKRKEYTEFIKKMKDSELKKKEIEVEQENRRIVQKREAIMKELETWTSDDCNVLENKVKQLEIELDAFKQKSIREKMDIEMWMNRIHEIKNTLGSLKEANKQEREQIKEQPLAITVLFNGVKLTPNDIKDDVRYNSIRKLVIDHKDNIINTTKNIESLKHEITVIDANIKRKEAEARAKAISDELNKLDMSAFTKLKEAATIISEKRNKLSTSESVIRGELKQIVQTLKNLNKELEQYSNVGKKYLTCSIEIKTLELATDDLEKCVTGLDKAIVNFHSSKIDEVNQILKDLWMNTYRGNDIDYIELKAESTDARAYNYRLVMIKRGVELDMRGRSSAGQKMIASILFRVALIDSFSHNCSVIALDEPTTNLDRENVESLANTLAAIIKSRKNVQFVVITHDEDFVQLLNREGTEYFYRLQRDAQGHSHIHRHSLYK